MATEMYFIPILQRALSKAKPEEALADAFEEIVRKGEHPTYRKGFMQFQAWLGAAAQTGEISSEEWLALLHPSEVGLFMFRDETIVERCSLTLCESSAVFNKILPGRYSLLLETGWLIWEASLTAEDLLRTEANPGDSLDLSASSPGDHQPPSRSYRLAENRLLLQIFPGLEWGRIEIRRCDSSKELS